MQNYKYDSLYTIHLYVKIYRDYHLVFGHNSRTEQAFCIFLNLAFMPPMQHCKSKCEKIVTIKSLTVVQQDSRNEVVGKGGVVRFHSSEHARDQKKWNKTFSLRLLFPFGEINKMYNMSKLTSSYTSELAMKCTVTTLVGATGKSANNYQQKVNNKNINY